MKLKLSMTSGTISILELALKHRPSLENEIDDAITDAMDESIEDHIFEEIAEVAVPGATIRFYVDASVDHLMLKGSYLTDILAIEYDSMSIVNVPEAKIVQHQERANEGFPAKEVVDIELLDGIDVIRVVTGKDHENGNTHTTYLLSHNWSYQHSQEEIQKCG